MEFNGRRGDFVLECYSVRNEDRINIVAVGAARLFYLGAREDGIVNDFINIGSCLISSNFFNDHYRLLDFVVRYIGSILMTDGMTSRRSLSPEFIMFCVIFRMGMIPV